MDAVERAIEAIDVANQDDPNRLADEPLALAQGRRAHDWVLTLDPDASPALLLAARAHHLRRWAIPRSTYPDGRPGYLRWRRDQKVRHAQELGELLEAAGLVTSTIARAKEIVAKVGLGSDTEVQVFEDAVCLTFIETQLGDTARRLDRDRMVDVIAKTLSKMSAGGRSAALTIDLSDDLAALVGEALER